MVVSVEREVSVEYRNYPVHDSVQKHLFNLRSSLGSATPWYCKLKNIYAILALFFIKKLFIMKKSPVEL